MLAVVSNSQQNLTECIVDAFAIATANRKGMREQQSGRAVTEIR